MSATPINIIGAGAMGHLWTAFLQQNTIPVRLYSRVTKPQNKFSIISNLGQFEQTISYHCLDDWQDSDVMLISVKAHQLEQVCKTIKSRVNNNPTIILLMNGFGLIEIVNHHIPNATCIQAYLVQGSYIESTEEQNIIHHSGENITYLGNIDSHYSENQFSNVIEILNLALPKVVWNEKHREIMIQKLIINAIINPLTAIHNKPNGCILQNGKLNEEAYALVSELKPLLHQILPDCDFESIKHAIERVATQTGSNISSMLQDIRHNRKTEIDFINGYLINFADKIDIRLPLHSEIVLKIKKLTS
ncbi:MAG: 2-dehydropantoate 2-reductase [Gammaproteobacteria bacterium]|nr:2-dehydropantoate 2-reductase [Gammaproteobacteria bacterium]